MDLTQAFPRSPKETMAGLVHLARMMDKARAHEEKTLGDYIYPCPLDKIILNFLGCDPEEFGKIVIEKNDEQVSQWAEEKSSSRSKKEKDFVNRQILERKPDSEDRIQYFNEIRDKIDPTRTDITTWVELLDLEEGRL